MASHPCLSMRATKPSQKTVNASTTAANSTRAVTTASAANAVPGVGLCCSWLIPDIPDPTPCQSSRTAIIYGNTWMQRVVVHVVVKWSNVQVHRCGLEKHRGWNINQSHTQKHGKFEANDYAALARTPTSDPEVIKAQEACLTKMLRKGPHRSVSSLHSVALGHCLISW